MSEKKVSILKRVELGEISVDEGLRLLEECDREERRTQRHNDIAEVRNALNDVFHEVGESLRDAGEAVNDVITDAGKELRENKDLRSTLSGLLGGLINLGRGQTFEFDHQGAIEGERVRVDLRGTNGKLVVRRSSGTDYRLHVSVCIRSGETATREQAQEVYSFNTAKGLLKLDVRQGLRGGVSAELLLPDNREYDLILNTSNGSIRVEDLRGIGLVADTSNGSVTMNGCSFQDARVETSNGSVSLNGTCGEVTVHTSNGSIRLDSKGCAHGTLDLNTSNGSITLVLIEDAETGYMVEASTSNGKVSADLQGLCVTVGGRNKLRAKSENYELKSKHTNIYARTSNGRISISHRE